MFTISKFIHFGNTALLRSYWINTMNPDSIEVSCLQGFLKIGNKEYYILRLLMRSESNIRFFRSCMEFAFFQFLMNSLF
jgi:hypothetical protein